MRRESMVLALALLLACAIPALAEPFPADFLLGVDVSELLAQEASGATYRDADGGEADALAVLAGYGVDCIRVRVWNDPFDGDGRGYGGGNCDVQTAATLSARAAKLGMGTLVDFHYSDFWADPSRQLAPKAWAGMGLEDKADALYAFTRESLASILDAGGDVRMVQVGNETNLGMAGEEDTDAVARLIAVGCAAVKDETEARGVEITAAIHLTNILKYSRIEEILAALEAAGARCDAVGLSYYPYWHGGLDNLKRVIESIRGDWGKDVFVAETAWPFTMEDGDGWGNVIGEAQKDYPATPEGQLSAFCNVCRAADEAGALGVYYWGGLWTPIGPDAEANWPVWEAQGSGWATRFAADYDPNNVGEDYGGCAWDNQALFDSGGEPLPILDALKQLSGGTFPEGVLSPAEEAAAAEEGENLALNPSFEDGDRSMWTATSNVADVPFDYQDYAADAHSGNIAFHYWSKADMDFTVEQTLTGLEDGVYEAGVWSQGGDMKDAELTFYAVSGGETYEAPFMNTSWANWQHPVLSGIAVTDGALTVGVHIRCGALGWGTLDDFTVIRSD